MNSSPGWGRKPTRYCAVDVYKRQIVQSMDKFYYQYGGIQLVVIDGIADLVKSANDEAESAVSYTHLCAALYHCGWCSCQSDTKAVQFWYDRTDAGFEMVELVGR